MESKKVIVLDVDRTVLMGTSWYHACKMPGLLLNENSTRRFETLNEFLCNSVDEDKRKLLRAEILCMIEQKISPEFLKIVDNPEKFQEGAFTDEQRFYEAGKYVASHLVPTNPYWEKLINLFQRKYDNDIKLIFLSSGYKQFISGVVDSLCHRIETRFDYDIIGTGLDVNKGVVVENGCFFSQERKKHYIEKILAGGEEVIFLGDDSMEDPELFDAVINNGGAAFHILYRNHDKRHSSWGRVYASVNNPDQIKNYLETQSKIKLASLKGKCFFEEYLETHGIEHNKIGILCMPEKTYNQMASIWGMEIFEILELMIHRANQMVYLRGVDYYFWMPIAVRMPFEGMRKRWNNMVEKSIEVLGACLNSIESETLLPLYIGVDHLLEAIYRVQYGMEQHLLNGEIGLEKSAPDFHKVRTLVSSAVSIMLSLLNGSYNTNEINSFYKELNTISWREFEKYINDSKGTHEMDDTLTIFKSVDTILNEMQKRTIKCDYVVSFAFGGISIGDFFSAEYNRRALGQCRNVTAHYSSKYKIRDNECDISLIDTIPDYYKKDKEKILESKKQVLLYDNNTTTFETLKDAGKELSNWGALPYKAVVSVNYTNICNWICKRPYYEELEFKWSDVLDFPPVSDYVTAYDTWGEGEKNSILNDIYRKIAEEDSILDMIKKLKNSGEPRKICRVHNIYDLYVACIAGATMIGIHVMFANKEDYFKRETKAVLKKNEQCLLPVPNYELEAIQAMVEIMPDYIMPILILENPIDVEMIEDTVKLLKLQSYGIQMQFRASVDYLRKLQRLTAKRLLLVVGLAQEDVGQYIKEREEFLKIGRDFILLDMSKHQPDFLAKNHSIYLEPSFEQKEKLLRRRAKELKNLEISIMLADDVEPLEMKSYLRILKEEGIVINALDMQNILEYPKEKQEYAMIKKGEHVYEAKIRKDIGMAEKWSIAMIRDEKDEK